MYVNLLNGDRDQDEVLTLCRAAQRDPDLGLRYALKTPSALRFRFPPPRAVRELQDRTQPGMIRSNVQDTAEEAM